LYKWPNGTHLTKTKGAAETLFSHHGLDPRLQAIKLLASLTYPLKITKDQPTLHPNMSHDLLLIDIRHCIGLIRSLRCRWCLKLHHLKLLLESGDRHCPLLEFEVLLLNGRLEVYNHVCAGVHYLADEV
jgi:hypothetical protein